MALRHLADAHVPGFGRLIGFQSLEHEFCEFGKHECREFYKYAGNMDGRAEYVEARVSETMAWIFPRIPGVRLGRL